MSLWVLSGLSPSVTDTADDIDRAIGHPYFSCIVAEQADDLVRSIIAAFDGWRGNVYRLAVHPAHRRLGIGRALVAAVGDLFSGWGVRRVTALVERENSSAVTFWRAVGYHYDHGMSRFFRNV